MTLLGIIVKKNQLFWIICDLVTTEAEALFVAFYPQLNGGGEHASGEGLNNCFSACLEALLREQEAS
jgi:hypothetical protein